MATDAEGRGRATTPRPAEADTSNAPDDVTRRTWLAGERTYLAWWRTSLTALAAGLAVSRVIPALAKSQRAPYVALGAGYSILGLMLILYALRRQRGLERALREGTYETASPRMMIALTAFSAILGVGTIVLVFVG